PTIFSESPQSLSPPPPPPPPSPPTADAPLRWTLPPTSQGGAGGAVVSAVHVAAAKSVAAPPHANRIGLQASGTLSSGRERLQATARRSAAGMGRGVPAAASATVAVPEEPAKAAASSETSPDGGEGEEAETKEGEAASYMNSTEKLSLLIDGKSGLDALLLHITDFLSPQRKVVKTCAGAPNPFRPLADKKGLSMTRTTPKVSTGSSFARTVVQGTKQPDIHKFTRDRFNKLVALPGSQLLPEDTVHQQIKGSLSHHDLHGAAASSAARLARARAFASGKSGASQQELKPQGLGGSSASGGAALGYPGARASRARDALHGGGGSGAEAGGEAERGGA
ncbi:hypothetical protein CYMTET_33155, partial [Cymbomonas tetramitiformis]